MVYKFRIISDEEKEFARELIIDSKQTFLDFHHCLQEDLGYDAKQLASFFLTNSTWEKQLQITLIDMMDEEGGNCITMDQATVGTHLRSAGQRMIYVFDFFSERSFFIELTEVTQKAVSDLLPSITYRHGRAPVQIDLGLDDLPVPEEDFMNVDTDFEGLDEDFDQDFDEDFNEDFGFNGSEEYTDD